MLSHPVNGDNGNAIYFYDLEKYDQGWSAKDGAGIGISSLYSSVLLVGGFPFLDNAIYESGI